MMILKAGLAIVLATVCALLFHGGVTATVAPSEAAAVAAPASTPAPAALPSLTTEAADRDECSASGTIQTEDAAACQDGGWQYAGCCTGGPIVRTKWTRNGISKCCGPCFF